MLNENIDISKYTVSFKDRIKELYQIDWWQENSKDFPEYLSFFKQELHFLKFINESTVTDKKLKPEPLNVIKKACFYNSLSYIKKYDDVELAWGYNIGKVEFNDRVQHLLKTKIDKDYQYHNIWAVPTKIIHAFCVKNGKIVDPTFGLSRGDFYVYKTVSKNIWEKFNWKENDIDFDGSDFCDYIYKCIDADEDVAAKWYLKNFV